MNTIEIIQQYGQFDASISQLLVWITSAFLAMVLVLGAVQHEGTKRKVFICCLLPLMILTAVAVNYSKYALQEDQKAAVRIFDSVLNGENKITEAKFVRGDIWFRIQTEETILLGTQIDIRTSRIVLRLEGAEKLNELYLQKNGVAMMPTQVR